MINSYKDVIEKIVDEIFITEQVTKEDIQNDMLSLCNR